jgi:phytoene dehydrogenase-like protein
MSDIGEVTIIGAGLAGLAAAITAAEDGAAVEVFEAHDQLGGRARSTDGPFVANFGPHALYRGLSNWSWLKQRGLLGEIVAPRSSAVRFYVRERPRRTLPLGLIRALPFVFGRAPRDQDFRSWAASKVGERSAALLCGYAGVIPGFLSEVSFTSGQQAAQAALRWRPGAPRPQQARLRQTVSR